MSLSLKAPVVSFGQGNLPSLFLVLVGSRNGFESAFTIELSNLMTLWKIGLKVK